jgi:5-methylcytosine-specific restriction endonuclease McrA
MKKIPEVANRKCRKCGIEFSGKRCLPCARAYSAGWRDANPEKAAEHKKGWVSTPEKRRATQLLYRQKNREYLAVRSAHYRALDPEKNREYLRNWRAQNLEKCRKREAEYRAANPEQNRQRVKAWLKMNPEKGRIIRQNRRARKLNAGGKLSPGLAQKLFALQKGRCACCGASLDDGYHLDHIMPLALGGANEDTNMQLLRKECNSRKHAKHPVDYMQERGFLL